MNEQAQTIQAFVWLLSVVAVIVLIALGKPLEAVAIAIVGHGMAEVR